ncbi:hypothetical protein ACN0TX_12105 [Staphylococcus cohnii]|uniref:hypothetical protein n=1 Tax=Staphylococcus cohnii TaxID=29382 RepID=UPI003AF48B02
MELEKIIKKSLGKQARLISYNDEIALVEFRKAGRKEFATYKYNEFSLYSGHYFTTVFNTEEEAKNKATINYVTRI